jgi:hypothetical protein
MEVEMGMEMEMQTQSSARWQCARGCGRAAAVSSGGRWESRCLAWAGVVCVTVLCSGEGVRVAR